MPNWCQNHLTVTGATPEFRAWLADHGFSFEKMNPLRKPRKSRKADPNGWSMLDLCCTAWGTKCDLAENEQRQVAEELLDSASAFFDTAWSPPMQAIEALSRKFPEVAFQLDYCELGMFFAGTAMFQDGECHDDFHEENAGVMKIACDIFGYDDEEDCELVAVA
jgi:hypothetical protein